MHLLHMLRIRSQPRCIKQIHQHPTHQHQHHSPQYRSRASIPVTGTQHPLCRVQTHSNSLLPSLKIHFNPCMHTLSFRNFFKTQPMSSLGRVHWIPTPQEDSSLPNMITSGNAIRLHSLQRSEMMVTVDNRELREEKSGLGLTSSHFHHGILPNSTRSAPCLSASSLIFAHFAHFVGLRRARSLVAPARRSSIMSITISISISA
jgi:hypothetical protein